MIDAALFARIHQQFGHVASWAVWADAGTRPKDHVGDLSVLSPLMNPTLLDTLHTKFVLMGLNISRALEHPVERPFGNFHDNRPIAQDYKIRYALKDTPLWGAYMTDVIKEYTERTSGSVVAYLRKNRDVEQAHIAQLRAEITMIGANNPIVVTFGRDATNIVKRYCADTFRIVSLPHYAIYCSQQQYRAMVMQVLVTEGILSENYYLRQ